MSNRPRVRPYVCWSRFRFQLRSELLMFCVKVPTLSMKPVMVAFGVGAAACANTSGGVTKPRRDITARERTSILLIYASSFEGERQTADSASYGRPRTRNNGASAHQVQTSCDWYLVPRTFHPGQDLKTPNTRQAFGSFTSRSLPVSELLERVLGELREWRRLVEVARFPEGGLGIVRLSGLGQGEPEPVVSGDHDRLELDGRAEGLHRLLRLVHPDVRLAHVVVGDFGCGVGGEADGLLVGCDRLIELALLGESDAEVVIVVGVVLVEIDGSLDLGLTVHGTAQVQVDETQGVMKLRVLRIELDRLPERGHAESQAVVGEVAHGIVVAVLGLELPYLLALRRVAGGGEREQARQ